LTIRRNAFSRGLRRSAERKESLCCAYQDTRPDSILFLSVFNEREDHIAFWHGPFSGGCRLSKSHTTTTHTHTHPIAPYNTRRKLACPPHLPRHASTRVFFALHKRAGQTWHHRAYFAIWKDCVQLCVTYGVCMQTDIRQGTSRYVSRHVEVVLCNTKPDHST
jgi:hypothetical protein